jgi:ferritin
MSDFDKIIFKDKSFSSILEDIYKNSKKKESQIKSLIEELKPLIGSMGDAISVVPLIKEYLEIGVKNDEQLIKMAAIIQRAMNSGGNDSGDLLTDDEINQLTKMAEEMNGEDVKKEGEDVD